MVRPGHPARARTPACLAAVCLAAGLAACGREAAPPSDTGPDHETGASGPGSVFLPDEAGPRGLDYVNVSGDAEKSTVLAANGAGVALLDLGGDGDLDCVFTQGLAGLPELLAGPGADLAVYENDGSGHFTRRPGPGLSGWWTGLATGDVDGDGDADLVAGGYGGLAVLLQDADGQLVPTADLLRPDERIVPGSEPPEGPGEGAGTASAPGWISSLALFDANGDGRLDLYAGFYLALDPRDPPLGQVGSGPLSLPCRWKGHTVFCGPRGLAPQTDRLYMGRGDGSFDEESAARLRGLQPGYTLALAPFDADSDGDTDLYVACDSSPNLLWINDGRGRFDDFALAAGVALSPDGAAEAGMGVAPGDVDGDGRLDFALTNFSGEATALYFGAEVGFENQTYRFGLLRETRKLLSWSVHLVDFDGDGDLELFTTNGHVYPQADRPDTGTAYGQPASCLRLLPRERRVEAVPPGGPASVLAPALGARGSAVGDVDGDGAPDIVLARIDGPCALGMNRGMNHGAPVQRLLVRCLGPSPENAEKTGNARRTPADGMGARAVLALGAAGGSDGGRRVLTGEVQTAVGYQSASSPWLHFGLGAETRYTGLRIVWPSGKVEELGPGSAQRRIWVREGEGIVRSEELPERAP